MERRDSITNITNAMRNGAATVVAIAQVDGDPADSVKEENRRADRIEHAWMQPGVSPLTLLPSGTCNYGGIIRQECRDT